MENFKQFLKENQLNEIWPFSKNTQKSYDRLNAKGNEKEKAEKKKTLTGYKTKLNKDLAAQKKLYDDATSRHYRFDKSKEVDRIKDEIKKIDAALNLLK